MDPILRTRNGVVQGGACSRLRSNLVGASDDIKWDEMWSNAPAGREDWPINFVDWYVAFAFCSWDGGRLPTEAEWEYAAAGGDENRLYPWGQAADAGATTCIVGEARQDCMQPVGSNPEGDGRFGQTDLGGGLLEFVFDGYDEDWYSGGGRDCVDCACITPPRGTRVLRGLSSAVDPYVRAAKRSEYAPEADGIEVGFRCAR